MSDDDKPKLTPANENPLYWLMTLHGEGMPGSPDIGSKNRKCWNRWMAATLNEKQREELATKGFAEDELKPFTQQEIQEFRDKFVARAGHEDATPLHPKDMVDFSKANFKCPVFLRGFLFSGDADFSGALFTNGADFSGATFVGDDFTQGEVLRLCLFQQGNVRRRCKVQWGDVLRQCLLRGNDFLRLCRLHQDELFRCLRLV
jgi:uncharacterized protein YjbI with pentapeptide repeats